MICMICRRCTCRVCWHTPRNPHSTVCVCVCVCVGGLVHYSTATPEFALLLMGHPKHILPPPHVLLPIQDPSGISVAPSMSAEVSQQDHRVRRTTKLFAAYTQKEPEYLPPPTSGLERADHHTAWGHPNCVAFSLTLVSIPLEGFHRGELQSRRDFTPIKKFSSRAYGTI